MRGDPTISPIVARGSYSISVHRGSAESSSSGPDVQETGCATTRASYLTDPEPWGTRTWYGLTYVSLIKRKTQTTASKHGSLTPCNAFARAFAEHRGQNSVRPQPD
jgi:hypothetical protein